MVELDYRQEGDLSLESSLSIPEGELKWSTVSLTEVLEKGMRLEASVFDVEGKHAREILKKCKWEIVDLWSEEGFVKDAFYPGRFKRIYVDKNSDDAVGFLGSAEMLDIKPAPRKFLSSKQNVIEKLKIEENCVLLSRSGTIGNLTFTSKTLERFLVSEHAIRIICNTFSGYVYTYLKTKLGQTLIKSNIYGAVVDQVEPEHLANIPIPNPPPHIKEAIHRLIMESFRLRDESNDLIDEAERLLLKELKLPPIEELVPDYFDKETELKNYSVKLSQLQNRLDASYHVVIVKAILECLEEHAEEVVTLGDARISEKIILPGRFKRVYVEEGQGTAFFGGKQLFELDPSNKKYLAGSHHKTRIEKELKLKENSILISRSGTIGKVNITPKHWENWVINEHIIRVFPINNTIGGYIYVWLLTEYGHELLRRFIYGAVVDEIDTNHVSQVQIPLLKNKDVQKKINDLVLEVNKKRYDAYLLEQKAIKKINDEVIYKT